MILEDALEKIYPKVLNFVALQARSKKETQDRLKRYLLKIDLSTGDKEELSSAILTRLEEEKLLDDITYAKDFVHSIAHSSKPRGKQYIKRFLFKKGIDTNIIDVALVDFETEDELTAALAAAEKKLKSIKASNAMQRKQKLWRYLVSRGFSSNIIGSVIDRVLGVE